jgi:acetylglutamate kinase
VKIPKGFRFSGAASGLKPQRRDLALVVSDVPAAAAGVFTTNRAAAAPVQDARPRVPAEGIRAVLANSGNANALTGTGGVDDVQVIRGAVSDALGIQKRAVLTASTGVIGVRLPAMKIVTSLTALVEGLGDHAELAAEAIMTTDTRPKMSSREIVVGGKAATVSAICKGSGMLAPQLATVLCVITTDVALTPRALQEALGRAVSRTFNMVNVDGDMSTNDTVYALANGLAGNARLADAGPDLETFENALTDLCGEMARAIAADGEGATRMVEAAVSGAPSDEAAQDCARSITGSPLVKAALFGADPNWGRIMATVGARAGSRGWPIDPAKAKVSLQGVLVFDGAPVEIDREALRARMRETRVDVRVDLGQGGASATSWGCDLSYEYVRINADYTSMIVQKPDGMMAKDESVANYSPSFKRTLLVEALKYIASFSGQVAVLKYGGAAMVKDSLKAAFAEDVTLLQRVGLKPVIVHGGALEINQTLERLGERSEFVDGLRVTDAASLPVVEMVLTGKVNQELVALINARDGGAVGVSGKDGRLLEARRVTHESGRDLGYVGEVTRVNTDFLRMLLEKDYVPVISPIGLSAEGKSLSINADDVAAHVAAALGAKKLIYLTDVPGLLESAPDGALVQQVTDRDLDRRLAAGSITGGMRIKALSILKALEGGVDRVHILDGRQPHTVIAELFTDSGVGTLVTRAAAAAGPR